MWCYVLICGGVDLFGVIWCFVVSCGVMRGYVVLCGAKWRHMAVYVVMCRYVSLCDVM